MTPDKYLHKIKITVLVSGLFTAFVGILLLLNYLQFQTGAPLESHAMDALIQRLAAEPHNEELKQEIRTLDLLSRKVYFTSLWQIRTGAYLMLLSSIVFLIALRIYISLKQRINKPIALQTNDTLVRKRTERWLIIIGVVIFGLALFAARFSSDYLAKIDIQKILAKSDEGNGIERLTIRSDSHEEHLHTDTLDEDTDTISKLPRGESLLTETSIWRHHNSFRGPWGNSRSKHTNIHTNWDVATGKNILWKAEVPLHGYNSPVIWGDKLFISGADEQRRVVFCYDRHSGTLLWEGVADNIPGSPTTPPKTTDDTGLAASTLTVDGQRVFAIFGTGDIIAFDMAGKRLWARNLGVPANHYGHSSSLITWDDKVFVQYDTQRGSRVMALDVSTGSTVWETPRSNDVSWGSPIIAKVNGEFRLVLLALPTLTMYELNTGRLLWSLNCMSGEVGTSPTYGGGLLYAANEYARMVAVNPTTGEKVWEDNYYLPEVSSPLYDNGLLYIATTFALVACFEAETGQFLWEYDTKDGFYSSPVWADGKIFVFDMKGYGYIFRSGREPRLIASHYMGEEVFATPAFADGRLYVRGNKHLFCIGHK